MSTSNCHNIYHDPAAYDLIHSDQTGDLQFYLERMPKRAAKVLELGCGSGRLTIPLALRELDVTGIDIENSMLARGREKAADYGVAIDWVRGDVRSFDLGEMFDAVLFPCNSISHLLDSQSVEACLACVRRHLADEGVFIFHTFNPSLQILTRDPQRRYPVAEYEDPSGRGPVVVTESNTYDRARQINNITWYHLFQATSQETATSLPLRMFFPQELDCLLGYNGFEVIGKYGGFDGSMFSSASDHQILVCSKAGAGSQTEGRRK